MLLNQHCECYQVFPTNTTTPFSEHVCFRRMVWPADRAANGNGSFPTYVAMGTTTGNIDTVRYAYSWEEDFADAIVGQWSQPRTLFLDAAVWMGACFCVGGCVCGCVSGVWMGVGVDVTCGCMSCMS